MVFKELLVSHVSYVIIFKSKPKTSCFVVCGKKSKFISHTFYVCLDQRHNKVLEIFLNSQYILFFRLYIQTTISK